MSGKKSKKTGKRPVNPAARKKAPGGPAVRGTVLAMIILVLAAVSLGAGIGIWKLSTGSSSADDSTVTTKFPGFVYAPTAPKESPKAYQAAIDHYDDFAKIPCYCGCGKSAGHDSLQACFIQSMSGSNIKYDNHGAG